MKSELTYCTILKTNINVTNMKDTIAYLEQHLEELRGNYVCVSNVHTTVMAFRDEDYRAVQNGGAMALPDGKPLSITSRHRGFVKADRVPGPDLMPKMFEESKEKNYRHYFYGGKKETLETLEKVLKQKYPWLCIVGMYSPPFRELTAEEDEDIVNQINDARPDFIWVALGAPKQEKWMAAHKGKLNGIMLGVGAAFEFEAGTVARAPKWMQELCLEWAFRIVQDPVRLIPRYISTNASYLWNVHKENKIIERKKRNKRIAMIGHKRIPSREGGVEIVVEELATRLVRDGYTVDAYNRSGYHVSGKQFDEKRQKYYNGIRIYTIPTFQNGKLNAIVYSVLATIRALFGRYKLIHFHAEGPCVMLWLPRMFGIKTVATIHGLDWQRSKWGGFASAVLKYGEKTAAKKADAVIVLSKNIQDYFEREYNRKTYFIPNGISKPEKREINLIRNKYGLKKDGYFLFLARIVPEKGVHYLIEAYNQLQTDKQLVIAGGSSHSGEYKEKINALAQANPDIVMTNFVQGQILEELYLNAYAFILPSDIEGMALSLLEAMSYGNCCVVSDIPENTEVVEDHAITFKKGDVEDLRKKLQGLCDEPEIVISYRRNAANFICDKYNWDNVVRQTEEIYEEQL